MESLELGGWDQLPDPGVVGPSLSYRVCKRRPRGVVTDVQLDFRYDRDLGWMLIRYSEAPR
jgi:hypothetical protein